MHSKSRILLLLGNPQEWHYAGEMTDLKEATGSCPCGHKKIRFLYTIHHRSGRMMLIGKSCLVKLFGASVDSETLDTLQKDGIIG